MNSTEIVEEFRRLISDEAEPYLWSDAEAFLYLDNAQKQFCKLTGGLGDGSSAVTQLAYTDASDWVSMSPTILKTRQATDSVTGRPVAIINFEDMRARGMAFDGRQGAVQAMVIGIEADRARLYPYPAAAGQINLIVDRMPLKAITDADQKIEIGEHHHLDLILWMAHRAYMKQDAETMNLKKSADFKLAFETYCFSAKAQKERAMHKTRSVNYGGI